MPEVEYILYPLSFLKIITQNLILRNIYEKIFLYRYKPLLVLRSTSRLSFATLKSHIRERSDGHSVDLNFLCEAWNNKGRRSCVAMMILPEEKICARGADIKTCIKKVSI